MNDDAIPTGDAPNPTAIRMLPLIALVQRIVMLAQILNAVIRHRVKLMDLGFIFAVIFVMTFVAWQVDIFETEGAATSAEIMIELDEVLLIGGALAVGLLIYSTRRLIEQKREVRRRILAEQQVHVLAYQDSLTGLPNRRQFDDALKVAIASPPGASQLHAVFFLDLNRFKKLNYYRLEAGRFEDFVSYGLKSFAHEEETQTDRSPSLNVMRT